MLDIKEIIIPIFAMTVLFVFPAVIGLVAILKWHNRKTRLYQMIEDAIEKQAPPEVISQLVAQTASKEEKEDKKSGVKHLCDAGIFLSLGIALLVFYYNDGPEQVIFPGTFLTLFGISRLCVAVVVAKREKISGE